MNEAGLDRGLRKALQPDDDSQEHVFDAPGLHLRYHPESECGAFVLLEPEAEDLLRAVRAEAERDVDRPCCGRSLRRGLNRAGYPGGSNV